MAVMKKIDIFEGRIYKAILDQTNDGIYFVDGENKIVFWNHGAQKITGYPPEEVMGRLCSDGILCHMDAEGRKMCGQLCLLRRAVKNNHAPGHVRAYLKHRDGRRLPVDVVSTPIKDNKGKLLGVAQIFRDASIYEEEARVSELLAKEASSDHLTGLLNRRKIEMELDLEIKKSKRLDLPLSIIFCDLDFFKSVNDNYGHPVGDEVLKGVSKQLLGGIREYDRVARYGGEEFLIMLPQTHVEIAVEIAERLRASVEFWRLIYQEKLWSFKTTISMGVAELKPGEGLESLILRADKALYKAKQSGRNSVFLS